MKRQPAHVSRRSRLLRKSLAALLCVCLLPLSMLVPLLVPAPAFAVEAAAQQSVAGSSLPAGAVELPDRETDTTRHYRMPDGTYHANVYSAPIHFRAADGSWQDINDTLVFDNVGVVRNAAGPATIEVASSSSGRAPIHIAKDGWSVDMAFLGGLVGDQVDLGNQADFSNVAPSTDLVYNVDGSDLKETLLLKSADAPSTFSFSLKASGLSLYPYRSGWAFFKPGSTSPSLYLGKLFVEDSAATPTVATDATMVVTPSASGATITYKIPQTWLTDPARVFPIRVDPSTNLYANKDTFVYGGNKYGTYGTQTYFDVGATSGNYYSYLAFDMSNCIPPGGYIDNASLCLYASSHTGGGITMGCGKAAGPWAENMNYYGQPGYSQQLFTQALSANGSYNYMGSASFTQLVKDWYWYWYSGGMSGQPNNGLELYQTTANNNVWTFSSHESSTNKPYLAIGYCLPTATTTTDHTTISADDSDTVSATVAVATGSTKGAENDIANVKLSSTAGAGGTRVDFVWDNGSVMYGDSNYTWSSAPGGGYYGVRTASNTYIDALTANWSVTSSSGTKYYAFKWKVTPAYGDYQNVPLTGSATMYGSGCWNSSAATGGQNVLPEAVTPSTSTQPLGWWRSSAGQTLNDQPGVGRGTVSLSWANAGATANGYKIMLSDGKTYRQVGQVLGSSTTTWSTSGVGIYPTDSEIAGYPATYTGDPFRHAYSPSASALEDSVTVGGYGGMGTVVTDGTYLYGRAWGTYSGPTGWHKIGTGLNGTAKGSDLGTIGPDFTTAKPVLSAFYLDGYIYNGYADTASSISGVWKGSSADSTETNTLSFTGKPLLTRSTGADVAGSTYDVLLASDGNSIYSVAYQHDSGTYNGFKVRVFDRNGAWQGDHVIGSSSYYTDGVLADGSSLYFINWTGDNTALVTKVRMSDWSVISQWSVDQGTTRAINGSYDSANNVFWLGRLDGTGTIYRYSGPGLDLRDNPNALFKKTTGDSNNSQLSYTFQVVPFNSAGNSASAPAATSQLQNRTTGATMDVRHTICALGEPAHHLWHTSAVLGKAANHQADALLDAGSLHLSATDLSIKSWGPDASLSRTYDSRRTTANHFTPGWLFNFDQSLAVTTSTVTYSDENGEQHSFAATQGAWFGPIGYYAKLTTSSAGYQLTFKDRSYLSFDATGKLLSHTDRNGNAVSYIWLNGQLTITAANGQSIVVSLDASGNVTAATYQTIDGTRQVNYSAAGGTVSYYPGTSDAYSVAYGYNGSNQLGSMTVLNADGSTYCGSDGKQAAAVWGFIYDGSNRLMSEHLPGWSTDSGASTTVTYTASTATLIRYGQVKGTNQTAVTQTYAWNPTGAEASHTNVQASGDPQATWTTTYGATDDPIKRTSPLGHTVNDAYDANGNLLLESDELGRRNSYVYDANNQCIRETDPRGDTTYLTYDANGNLITVDRQLNDTDRAHSSYTYDPNQHWLKTKQFQQLNATTTGETDYSNFASSGAPQTITNVAVWRDDYCPPGVYPAIDDLTTIRTCNAFGDPVTEQDALGNWVTQATGYTPAGRVSYTIDGVGTVTHHAYDILGDETETSRTAGSAFADWVTKSYDAQNRLAIKSFWADSGSLDHTVSHSYDQMGRELTVTDSTAGSVTKYYDATGNTLFTWELGADTSSSTAAFRSTFDVEGHVLTSTEAGVVASSTATTYFADGSVKKVTNPDGSWTAYTYDDGKNPIAETRPTADGGTATDTTVYDVGGRVISRSNPYGETTYYTYDLLNHQLSAHGASNAASTTRVYNALGWVLSTTDADGITTWNMYSFVGRVGTRLVGNAPAQWFYYDVLGKLLRQNNADGTGLTASYDAFGRKIAESNYSSTSLLKSFIYGFDTLSRSTGGTDTLNNVAHSNTYGAGGSIPTSSTMSYANAISTASYSAAGTETARTASIDGATITRSGYLRDGAGHLVSWITSGMPQPGTATFNDAGCIKTQGGYGWNLGATYTRGATGLKTNDSISLLDPAASFNATYTYDGANRLASSNLNSRTTTYGFDAGGRIATVRASGLPTETFAYDVSGHLATVTVGSQVTRYSYEASSGARSTVGPISYSWDSAIHLQHYRDASRSVDATFAYDGHGQRTTSVVTSSGVTTTASYTYDGLGLLSLTATDSTNATYTITYLYDEDGRPYAASYKGTDATAPIVFHLVTTDRGDVVELLTSSGQSFASYRYDVWGNQIALSSAAAGSINATQANSIATKQPLRYAGYCYDGFSGLYYLSARYYDPSTLQFISKDPAKADGEESAYQYCAGDPVSNIDPSGQARVFLPTEEYQGEVSCASAAAKIIINVLIGQDPSEDDIAAAAGLSHDDVYNNGMGADDVQRALRHWGIYCADQHPVVDVSFLWWHFGWDTWGMIKNQINQGTPIWAGLFSLPNIFAPGHAVVIDGYDDSGKMVRYTDPYDGKHHEEALGNMLRGWTLPSGAGHYIWGKYLADMQCWDD